MKIVLAPLLFIIVAGTSVFSADDCQDIRLDQNGHSFSHIPVYDQGSGELESDMCYAYVASQMADAWRFSHGDKDYQHLTSPTVVAVQYTASEESSADDIRVGNAELALEKVLKNGSCSQKRTDEVSMNSKVRSQIVEFYRLHKIFKSQKSQQNKMNTAREILCLMNVKRGEVVDTDLIKKVLSALQEENRVSFLNLVQRAICTGPHLKILKPKAKITQLWARETDLKTFPKGFSDKINNNLDHKPPQPTMIAYCGKIVGDPEFHGVVKNPDNTLDIDCQGGRHASIIIGRRRNAEGVCQYLLRNTRGTSCNSAITWDCENGQRWIDRKSMLNNIYRLGTMEEE